MSPKSSGSPGTPRTTPRWPGAGGLLFNPARVDGVHVLGMNEHVWRPTRNGDQYVTVIIDRTGPARLLDMISGRFEQAFKTWLAAHT